MCDVLQDDAPQVPLGPEPHQSVEEIQRIVTEARVKVPSSKPRTSNLDAQLDDDLYDEDLIMT